MNGDAVAFLGDKLDYLAEILREIQGQQDNVATWVYRIVMILPSEAEGERETVILEDTVDCIHETTAYQMMHTKHWTYECHHNPKWRAEIDKGTLDGILVERIGIRNRWI